jgi:hypothetical protein
MVPAASRAQARAGTSGLCRRTVAIRCAESGDLNLSRRRYATHRGWSGGRNACVGAGEKNATPSQELGSSVKVLGTKEP